MAEKKFISDAEMQELEKKPKSFISDEEMMQMESTKKPKEESFGKQLLRTGVESLPSVGAAAGGLLGGVSASVPTLGLGAPGGAVVGAALGGSTGTALRSLGRKYLLDEPETTEQFAKEQLMAPLTGAASEMGGQVVGKLAGAGVQAAKKGLQEISETAAFKQAGGMLKDFRLAMGKKKLGEIGQDVLETKVSVPTEGGVKTEMLYKPGDKVSDIARKSVLAKKQVGEEIGSIYKQIDSALEKEVSPSVYKEISKASKFDPKIDSEQMLTKLNEKYGKKLGGQKVMEKVADVIGEIQKRGSTLEESLALKNEIDDMINYSKLQQDLPDFQKALIDIRNTIRDKTNNFVESVGPKLGVEAADSLRALNKKFGNLSTISEMSADKTARESANRMFSLTDYLAGGAGVAASGPTGLLAVYANKLARERGPGLLAVGSRALKGVLPEEELARQSITRFSQPMIYRGLDQ